MSVFHPWLLNPAPSSVESGRQQVMVQVDGALLQKWEGGPVLNSQLLGLVGLALTAVGIWRVNQQLAVSCLSVCLIPK